MKALAPQFVSEEIHKERLRREARAAASLAHEGIATIYSLEGVRGHSVHHRRVRGRRHFENGNVSRNHAGKRILKTSIALTRAVAAAHARGIIHRDLKPENVIRTAERGIKILDFAWLPYRTKGAQPVPRIRSLTEAGSFIGTAAYASPEQLRGREVSYSTDVFSLGVMMYEMASGMHPFGGSDSISTIARIWSGSPRTSAR